MADIMSFILPLGVGTKAIEITGKTPDGASAGGYAAWIQSITGKVPYVERIPDTSRARVLLDEEQIMKMRKWLDKQLLNMLTKPKTPPTLEIDMSPVFGPWALKYVVPVAVLLVIAGWVGHWYLSR